MVYDVTWWQRLLLILGANLLIFGAGKLIRRRYSNTIEKLFILDPKDASQVIENVLNHKNLPYRKERNGRSTRFVLEANSIEIRLQPHSPYRHRFSISAFTPNMALVRLYPVTDETKPLIMSLTQHLNRAFTPQGLQT